MRPLKLTLAGFHGIRDGMHRDSVTVDLSTLPGGLIALVGPNGAGKTTIMDNLHPFPIMPSHASKMSADAFSYWDHLCAPRAEKDLEWEHGGKTYRSAFAFRNPGKSRKAEYYLFEKHADGDWKPVQLADGTLSDGKADTYNRCLETVLGSLEAFFTSVFSAQNRRPLASYQPSEIKKLLAELLGIDHLRDLSAKAGEVAKLLTRSLDTLQRDVLTLTGKRDRAVVVAREIRQMGEGLDAERNARDSETAKGAKLLQERATLAAKQAANAGTEARLRELNQRKGELDQRATSLTNDEQVAAGRVTTRRRDLDRQVAGHRAVLAEAADIEAASGERDVLQLAIGRRQDEIASQRAIVEKLDAVQVEHAALSTELKGLEQQGVAGAKLADSLKLQAEVIEAVPCRDDPMHATCPLLAHARNAKVKLGEQVVSVKALRESYRKKLEQVQSMQGSLSERATARAALSALEAHLVRDQQLLQRLTAMAAKKPLLDAAREGLAQAERDLTALSEEDASRIERHKRDIADVQSQVEAVRRELATLATEDVTGILAHMDRQIAASREAVAAIAGRIEALIRQESMLVSERERLDVELVGMPNLEAKAQALSDQIAQWKLLAKGLGNDGVIALSIDDAGPAITQIVNDLLLACYGPRFTIAIQTQTALASGELREGFSINVIDADNDTTKEFGVMSGGQKVWINECLTRGIALYRAQDAQQPFQTLFTDEADGPLDPERKRAFMKMKREVLRVGGYEREYFISQTPDLVDDADGVIDVVALALQ
ncbi:MULTISPECIES: AAA family ATPase [unclassified Cupriavidus]|uniref:AAA family ATPase n=1 Tax=unclassified Cupriavidus TaxID=2640874 RepID=UPI0010F93EA2|nr:MULTISPECIES: AAA family ATPase [unclassified Cupriavidus]MWL91984.1 AAA family ATPase [Cupriavidus sp. SW-Y-13]